MDQESVASQQFGWQQPAHAHSAQATVLRQPATTRIVSGHHHRFDAHNVAVTATDQTHKQIICQHGGREEEVQITGKPDAAESR